MFAASLVLASSVAAISCDMATQAASNVNGACEDKGMMVGDFGDDDIATLVARRGNVSQMIFPFGLHRKANSHTRFIPSYCAVRIKEIY